eukprot:Pgem_evm1s15406
MTNIHKDCAVAQTTSNSKKVKSKVPKFQTSFNDNGDSSRGYYAVFCINNDCA